jgi:hypothetical protein
MRPGDAAGADNADAWRRWHRGDAGRGVDGDGDCFTRTPERLAPPSSIGSPGVGAVEGSRGGAAGRAGRRRPTLGGREEMGLAALSRREQLRGGVWTTP